MDKRITIATANRVRLIARRSIGALLLVISLCLFTALPIKLAQESRIIQIGDENRQALIENPEFDHNNDSSFQVLDQAWSLVKWIYPWGYFVCPTALLLISVILLLKKPKPIPEHLLSTNPFDRREP